MKCPLKNHEYPVFVDCAGQSCAFADEAGDCLVRQALQCYVNVERARVDRLRRETELARAYWILGKDEAKSRPIQFLKDGDTTPYVPPANPDFPKIDMYDEPVPGGITWVHQPSTEKHPHGGWFEDLSNLRREPE